MSWRATKVKSSPLSSRTRGREMGILNFSWASTHLNFFWTSLTLYSSDPDGYAYSHKTDRLWRKNRQSTGSTACVGVDVNRNFDVGFGEIGTVSSFVDWMASNNTCDEMYHGPNSFSSSEAKSIQSAIHHIQRNQKLAAYLTVHSYGQVITTYGFL